MNVVKEHRPDVLFLDVEMPEFNGLEVLEQLGPLVPRIIVFCTAYDRFAVRAFDLHALDYLLKPIDRERFEKAIERIEKQLEMSQVRNLEAQLKEWIDSVRLNQTGPDRIAVKNAGRIILVKLTEIDWVQAADNYVEIHVGKESHLYRETMNTLEERVHGRSLVRISRSVMVNIDRVKELQPLFHGDYSVVMQDGTRLTLSRNYRDHLERLFGKRC